ncbi:MAG: DUF72 domain-containing protein, partial [Gemmatimonadetes bacterium]|nr:DUF72 domain-containing protein [Gemmatimonadota bacterium]
EEAEYLVRTVRSLGARLGILLFQLPPNFKQDLERLSTFLNEDLPPGVPVAFEFRHDSWQNEDTYAVLREADCALCVADTDEGDTPLISTADTGYVRLRRTEYSDEDLKTWADRIRDAGWKDAFVFFKHEDEAAGPKMALRFRELAG